MKKALYLFVLIVAILPAHGQILHTESFSVILDSSKTIKGSIVPDFKFQNQKKDLIEFENTSDISYRGKAHAITLANKIELSKYGNEVLLSGGYLYLEYRRIYDTNITIEPFSQLHWTEARGLELKYAGGVMSRFRIVSKQKIGLFAGTGLFYEYERWNYDGVPDSRLPASPSIMTQESFKSGSYMSFKWNSSFNFSVDISGYHQSRFKDFFSAPRLAGSTSIAYSFTEHLGLILIYQYIYDYKPIVPIDKLFNKVVFAIDISF